MRVYHNPEVKAEGLTPASYDNYLGMELLMDCEGNTLEFARVIKRLCDDDRNPMGTAHENPILGKLVYEKVYYNGYTVPVSASIIAVTLFNQGYDIE